jgi:hypothetical protein
MRARVDLSGWCARLMIWMGPWLKHWDGGGFEWKAATRGWFENFGDGLGEKNA